MADQKLTDLSLEADRALREGDFERALSLQTCVLCAQPGHLDARLRVADCLLALGQVQRAAGVYTAFARHAANCGYPLRAIVAIKVLSALSPELAQLVDALAGLYAADGERVGRGARPVPAPDDVPVTDEALALLELKGEALWARAQAEGEDLSRCHAVYPAVLPPIALLSQLTRADFVTVLNTVALVRRQQGERVITQGDEGTSFFLIARGEFEVAREAGDTRTALATLGEGAVFGEMALVARSPRTAHVTAKTSGDVLEFQVDALARLSGGASAIARALERFTRERLVMNLMTTAPLFRPLSHEQRIDLVRRFTAHEVAAMTDIIREGESVPGLYVVLDGAVDVWKLDGAEKVLLATLRAGDVFGEMSLLNDAPASASVTTAQRSTVLLLAREYFDRLVEGLPTLRSYLEGLGEERALDTNMWLDTGAVSAAFAELPREIEVDLGDL